MPFSGSALTTVFSMSRVFSIQPTPRTMYSALPFLDHLAADRGVGLGDGRKQLAQGHVVGAELVGVHVDLVFDREAAGRGHLGHAGDRVELVAHVPILNGAQAAQVLPFALDRVPENLAQGRGVGGHVGHDARRQERAGQGQPLQHPLRGRSRSRCCRRR